MKIVLISLARRGGMVHFLAELANALAPRSTIVVVASSLADRSYFARGVKRIPVWTGRNAIQRLAQSVNPLMWFGLLRRLSRLGADAFHIVGAHQWNPMLAVIIKLLGGPLIYTVHDPEAHPGSPLTMRAGDWITAKMADQVVVLNRYGRTRLLARGFKRGAISVIRHPMYTLFRRWRPRQRSSRKIILHFGRIETYKGLEVLIQAFDSNRESMPGWKLIVAGSGTLRDSSLGRRTRDIEILNRYVPDREVARLMQMAAFVALPYTSATQSGVIALAQAFGRPVVATSVGGLKEMVVPGKTGILVPPHNVTALGRALVSLATDPRLLARMRDNVARSAKASCDPSAIAIAHLVLYREVLGRQARR